MILGRNTKVNLLLDGNKIERSQVLLLGITVDEKQNTKVHASQRARKYLNTTVHASQRTRKYLNTTVHPLQRARKYLNTTVHASQRVRKYLNNDKAKTLCNAFTNSQFYHAPLIWFAAKLLS